MNESASSAVLRVEAVQFLESGASWNFSVSSGEALWIPDARDSGMAWLNWLTGIEPPPRGKICWKGLEWRERPPAEASAERGRIGCVFAAGGVVVNLDMDENVWLPSLMHRREDAEETIEKWARFFGCWPLPQSRASTVPERERRRVLWTRAFSGKPDALVLEQPLRDMLAEDRTLFLEAVKQARADGCAVVWLDEALAEETRAALDPLDCVTPEPD